MCPAASPHTLLRSGFGAEWNMLRGFALCWHCLEPNWGFESQALLWCFWSDGMSVLVYLFLNVWWIFIEYVLAREVNRVRGIVSLSLVFRYFDMSSNSIIELYAVYYVCVGVLHFVYRLYSVHCVDVCCLLVLRTVFACVCVCCRTFVNLCWTFILLFTDT